MSSANIITAPNMQSDAKDILEAAARFSEAGVDHVTGSAEAGTADAHFITLPNGRTMASLKPIIDQFRISPERKTGVATLTTMASFIDHVNRTKDTDSVIFASTVPRGAAKMIAVYDYNTKDGKPRFAAHRAEYAFPFSDEYKAWTGIPENMKQQEFAELLETRIMDVADPGAKLLPNVEQFAMQLGISLASPQRLMELSRGLTLHSEHQVGQNVVVGSGEMSLSFKEEHTDASGAPLKVPGGFAITIPIFRDGTPYMLPVRLRYRVNATTRQVVWTLQPQRLDAAWDDAVADLVETVTKKTDLPVFSGTPEH